MANRARRWPADPPPPTVRSVAAPGSGERWYARYALLLGPVLAAYLFLDRGVAHLHVPGTPLYLGETLLAVGLVGALLATGHLRGAIASDPLLSVLTGFMLWGLVRAVPQVEHYGLYTLRDSALWYYGLFALLLVASYSVLPDLLVRLSRQFSRLVPLLAVWLPFALVFEKVNPIHIHFPGSDVPALSHKPGNIEVVAVVALAFMWLVPDPRRSTRSRAGLSVLALLTIGATATQNRGGAFAGALALAVGLCFRRDRARLVIRLAAVALVALGLAGLAGLSVSTGRSNERNISVGQLLTNLKSLSGAKTPGNLQATVDFRKRLLTRVLAKEVHQGKVMQGFGFGPNLALVGGVSPTAAKNPNLDLRSPHDSTFDVLARMGVIGLALWGLLWLWWFVRLARARSRLGTDDLWRRSLIEWCLVAVLAILVNSFFDPTLEGAQVAALCWTLFGVGAIAANQRLWTWQGAASQGFDLAQVQLSGSPSSTPDVGVHPALGRPGCRAVGRGGATPAPGPPNGDRPWKG